MNTIITFWKPDAINLYFAVVYGSLVLMLVGGMLGGLSNDE